MKISRAKLEQLVDDLIAEDGRALQDGAARTRVSRPATSTR